MSHSADVRAPSAPPLSEAARGLLQWLSCNNPLKKITDPFAALSIWGSYVRLRI